MFKSYSKGRIYELISVRLIFIENAYRVEIDDRILEKII